MTLIDMSKAIWGKVVQVAKFYNERPITFFVSISLIMLYFFLISDGFKWDLGHALERMLLGNKYHPEEIYIGWTLTLIHLLILFTVTKKLKK